MKHPNYEFLIAVANGEDLSEWEFKLDKHQNWSSAANHGEVASIKAYKFRRKQKTITINGIEVPEPMRVSPAYGSEYWVANPCFGSADRNTWTCKAFDIRLLLRGICHSTESAAEQHRRALILASGGNPDYKD